MSHPVWRSVMRVSRPFSGRLGAAWLRAVPLIVAQRSSAAIQAALLHRDRARAVALSHPRWTPTLLLDVAHQYAALVVAAAQHAMSRVTKAAPLDPLTSVERRAAEIAASAVGDLITQLDDEGLAGVRAVISRAMRRELSPHDAQMLLRQIVGLNERQTTALANYRDSLAGDAVAPDRIERLTERYAGRLLRQRAEMIDRTEVIRAANDGQEAAWRAARDEGMLDAGAQRVWIASPDACDDCLDLDGETTSLDDPFSSGDDGPPAHPNCRCAEGLSFGEKRESV
jgi:hypothetical protein